MRILESMGGSRQPTQQQAQENHHRNGVRVQVPKPPHGAAKRRWTDIPRRRQQQQALATSASTKTVDYEPLKIECRPCANSGPESGARAFVMGPTPLSIVLCSNRLSFENTEEMEQVLVHELMHVYDVRVNQLDLRACENLAYSEVRAAREAECAHAWLAGSICIPHKALSATANLFPPEQAKACIQRVMKHAMQDSAPFDIPKKRRTFHLYGQTPSER